jgi:hypothetical protein
VINPTDTPESLVQELRNANAALVQEVRETRRELLEMFRQTERRRVRYAVASLVLMFSLPALLAALFTLFIGRPSEPYWERRERLQQEQLERTDRALNRAERLLGRYEKVAPKE